MTVSAQRPFIFNDSEVRHEAYKLLSRVLGTVCAILLTMVGWLGSLAWDQLTILQQRVAILERQQAVSIQVHDSFANGLGRLEAKLDRIEAALHSRR